MIARMKKFLLIILNADSPQVPAQVRKLGIAHIEQFESKGDTCAALELALKDAQGAKNILLSNLPKKKAPASNSSSATKAKEVIGTVLSLHESMISARDRIADLKREAERIQSWGEFEPALLASLGEKGLTIRFIETLAKDAPDPNCITPYIRLAAPKGKKRFATLGESHIPVGYEEFKVPALSLSEIRNEISKAQASVKAIQAELSNLSSFTREVEKRIEAIKAALTLERLKQGMPSEGTLRYFSGFVPEKAAATLSAEASARGWGLALSDPEVEDTPPTKVENSSFVRIIQPVFDFLGTVPGYREYDISPYFLGFFSLYFAMIFGDAGYGMLMLVGSSFALLRLRSKKRDSQVPDFLKLVFLLSGTTILWGLATGALFALPYNNLPAVFKMLTIHAFSSANLESGTNVKIFCFVIGVVQLSIAHLKNIKRDFPDPKFLAQLGSLAMVVGMFNAVLNLVIDAQRFPLTSPALAMIGIGFSLVLTFGNWNGNFFSSLLEGLKAIIPTFLGTVSVFADIVSYIRLWAVALAGLAISETLNGMVVKLLGDPAGRVGAFILGFFFSLILLVVGHSLNFVMSVLSVVVHGIRLNMLEFSSHLGMEWTGYPYEPLSEPAEDNEV